MILHNFYRITQKSVTAQQRTTEIEINKDHEIYNGHFPGRPVTPGVVLMQLFKEEVERHFQKQLQLVRAENVKFMAVCNPSEDAKVILESEIEETGEFIKLKGLAKNGKGNVLKISSLYRILS
ncbi:hydroxymyristoyl-ACP dehydratase [Christiangramia flava]|uniref:(3R)-hydroxymyristoyl-[ACP] dehydratase n=1 Tax=Christiangramia flava JLT2011 TaxID=1229726 RepID=A0A1L7I8Z6_9FLAO|nr:hydroxymyristoyl-ACP dehydratase [Christiangramia flava]APU70050.1 (3R)-hydroxymyristoyl-[ACP] dehydratase [Christiangramia flava JLT2011]OSS39535.1 (3R)-hydroxymyristoyl-[acyl carrier protein] dehydratase [Christiangramia flava JLT2011]